MGYALPLIEDEPIGAGLILLTAISLMVGPEVSAIWRNEQKKKETVKVDVNEKIADSYGAYCTKCLCFSGSISKFCGICGTALTKCDVEIYPRGHNNE